MYRILKIGMDVHTTNYTLCALESKFGEEDQILANIKVGSDHKNVLDFIKRIKEKMDPKGQDELPKHLAEGKSNRERIRMCFEASEEENWQPIFD